MKQLIIFDCDGVLVDSEFITSKIFSETLSKYHYKISVDECIKRFTGVSEEACRKIIKEETGIHIPENYWILQQPTLMQAYEKELTPLMQPVLEMLDTLRIPRCIASNSPRNHVVRCLEITQQLHFFSDGSIFTSQQVAQPKPAPDLFLHAAKQMGVDPKQCIVVEDSVTGMSAARAAGMEVLLFLGASHSHFDWYRSKMDPHKAPMLSNCYELSEAIQKAFSKL